MRTPMSKQQPGRGLSPPGSLHRQPRQLAFLQTQASSKARRPSSPPTTPRGGAGGAEPAEQAGLRRAGGGEQGEEPAGEQENPLAFLAMAASMEVGVADG